MPVATMSSPTSPSPRISKAAFFRARSPPIEQPFPPSSAAAVAQSFDLQARLDSSSSPARAMEGLRIGPGGGQRREAARYSYDSTVEHGSSLELPVGRMGEQGGYSSSLGTHGHSPRLDGGASAFASSSSAQPRQHQQDPPVPPRRRPTYQQQQQQSTPTSHGAFLAGVQGALSAPDSPSEDVDSGLERSTSGGTGGGEIGKSVVMGIAGGSDEMLMTLLAGQAAVDCEGLGVGGWEEVEGWKKELTLLSSRVESLEARYQREVKILTAARTLQKLNTSNKRMSKQTMESLEQSEKRVEAAEKELLILRDREASLRRRLMEHWSGVMAWEVRRLERISGEAQSRFNKQSRVLNSLRDKEAQTAGRATELERELQKGKGRVEELEEMVVEMGRRERAIEEELKELDDAKHRLEGERDGWTDERQRWEREKGAWVGETRRWEKERDEWAREREAWRKEKDALVKAAAEAEQGSKPRGMSADPQVVEQVRAGLAGILGRKGGAASVGEGAGTLEALQQVKSLMERRENEVAGLKEEMREVNEGLEGELKRVGGERDNWKMNAEKAILSRKAEVEQLQRQARQQSEEISDLTLRNESLSTSLAAAQSAVSNMSSTSTQSSKSLQTRVDALTAELDAIHGQFQEVWNILPSQAQRAQAELVDPRTGMPNASLVSPSKAVNFLALQQLFTASNNGARGNEEFGGIDAMLQRIRGMVDDGRILVERVVRLGQERELHKGNAAKAKKLVEDSRHSLETYQQQVAVLEDRLAKSGSSESHFLEELNSLRASLEASQTRTRTLETQLKAQTEQLQRLQEANDVLSQRALTLADEAEKERSTLSRKMGEEMEEVKRKLREAEEDADEERSRGQGQRIQLLDELNSLQAEVGELRKQLRAAQRPGK